MTYRLLPRPVGLPPRPVTLLIAAWASLLLAWVGSNPTGSSPDETAHLVKALGVASGDLTGAAARYAPGPEFGPDQLEWINSVTRAFAVPKSKTFGTIATCNAFRPQQPATCIPVGLEKRAGANQSVELTHVGPYQPLPYLALGIPARLAPGGAAAAVAAGRLVVALAATGLLALAALALWSAASGAWSLLGLVVGVSPMVVFLGSSFSPSGIEIAAGACSAAGVVATARLAVPKPIAWAALGVGCSTMALARTTGPYWMVAMFLVLLVLVSPAGLRDRVRKSGRRAVLALAAPLVAAAATVGWDLAVLPAPAGGTDLGGGIPRAFAALPELMRQAVGVFGWLDTAMPALAYAAWRLMLVGLVLLALLVGRRRDRMILLLSIGGVVTATVGLALFAVYPTNFGTQARYTLPLALIVPVLAGEIVARERHRLTGLLPRSLPLAVSVTAAAVHLVGFWSNGRRNSVGTDGPVFFLGHSQWVPPGGWVPWMLLAGAGTVALAAALWSPRPNLAVSPEGKR